MPYISTQIYQISLSKPLTKFVLLFILEKLHSPPIIRIWNCWAKCYENRIRISDPFCSRERQTH